jgi:hypothetical protein
MISERLPLTDTVTTSRSLFLLPTLWMMVGGQVRAQEIKSGQQDSIAASAGDFVARPVFWTEDQTPADFLDATQRHAGARCIGPSRRYRVRTG